MSRFDYIQFDSEHQKYLEVVRKYCKEMESIVEKMGPSREKSLTLTALEQFYMWVGKAVRHDQILRYGTQNKEVVSRDES